MITACMAIVLPTVQRERRTFNLLSVLDITGSMNTRDMLLNGRPVSRLDMMKDALRQLLTALRCESRMGVAIFTERRPFLLFEPVEVCSSFEALDREIAALDWRMAWEGDSHIASGLYRSVALAGDLDADLIFMSDGQEAPPPPWIGRPYFEGKAGLVKGLIVGAGGYKPSPIPKFDEFGHETGFWQPHDTPNENVNAPRPPGPRNARDLIHAIRRLAVWPSMVMNIFLLSTKHISGSWQVNPSFPTYILMASKIS